MPLRLSMSTSDWLLLIVLSVLWGSAFYLARIALDEIPPLTLAAIRVGIAALTLAPMAFWLYRGARLTAPWHAFVAVGILNNALPFSLIFWGQLHIPSGLASVLIATTPFFTLVVSHFATADDRITPQRVVGLAAGLIGVALMVGPDMLRVLDVNVAAQFACLIAALSYTLGGVYWRRYRSVPPITASAGALASSTLIMIVVAATFERPWTIAWPSMAAVGATLALGIFATAFGYIIFFRVLARAGATNVMLVSFLIPVTAILLGTVLLGERFSPNHFAGMVAIAIGLAAIDGRPLRALAAYVRSR
ncbi:MAG: EamA family transporter [Proteobacteria bacterium]|nr:EamA family transporter [Pseudomonadota bacterium]